MFFSSFSPLFFMFAVRTQNSGLRWTLGGVGFVSLATTLVLLWILRGTEPTEVTVISVEAKDAEVVSYLVTYLLPFLLVVDPNLRDIIALSLFLAVLGILYIRSNMLYVNPVLALLGYHLFLVRTREGSDSSQLWVLSKGTRVPEGPIQVVRVAGNVRLRREDRE
jgi:hypothetical protein